MSSEVPGVEFIFVDLAGHPCNEWRRPHQRAPLSAASTRERIEATRGITWVPWLLNRDVLAVTGRRDTSGRASRRVLLNLKCLHERVNPTSWSDNLGRIMDIHATQGILLARLAGKGVFIVSVG